MFNKITKKDKRTNLEKEIDVLLDTLKVMSPDSEEYSAIVSNLERLYKMKTSEKDRRISPDTLFVVAGNLLGLVLIMNYERANIITTKALGFVIKGRV